MNSPAPASHELIIYILKRLLKVFHYSMIIKQQPKSNLPYYIFINIKMNTITVIFIISMTLTLFSQVQAYNSISTQSTDKVISNIRKVLPGKTLIVKWKLDQEQNFRLNQNNHMVNILTQSNQRKRSSSTYDFFSASPVARLGNAFFEAEEKEQEASSIYLELFGGPYSTGELVMLQIPLDDSMDKGISTDKGYKLWQTTKRSFITCTLFKQEKLIGKFYVEAKVEITTNIPKNLAITSTTKIWVDFKSNSFSFYADLQGINKEFHTFVYIVGACSILFLASVIFLKPKKSVYNLSEWMIIQIAAFTFIANIILFCQGFTKLDTIMWVTSICAFVNIGSSLLFLRNFEDVVRNQFNNRIKAICLAVFLIVYLILVYSFWKSLVFWIYEGFILLALQISYAYSKGGKGGMSLKLLFTIIVTRVPFIYYRFCMQDLTRRANDPILLIAFIGINIILLTFIFLQRYFGSRFLIPKELIPDYYSYFKDQIDLEIYKEQCSICTVSLEQNPDITEDQSQKISSNASNSDMTEMVNIESEESKRKVQLYPQVRAKKISLMVTPCSHYFHRSCLQDWMDKRLNCPLCRTTLPPSQQQRDDSYCC